MLKSVHLILVVAVAPQASFFNMGCGMQKKESTLSVTGFVTPFTVKSPTTDATLSPSNFTLVDLKVMVGYLEIIIGDSPQLLLIK
ncbi:MAG: hypothetical protein WA123_05435 [Methylotenera sp.]